MLLLDTHLVLWAAFDPGRLSPKAAWRHVHVDSRCLSASRRCATLAGYGRFVQVV
jgi:PIN domain nuclease of toxin-antitoxin system